MSHFTETSTEPYDRQHYRVIFQDDSYIDVESYENAQIIWQSTEPRPRCIDVLAAPKQSRPRGF